MELKNQYNSRKFNIATAEMVVNRYYIATVVNKNDKGIGLVKL